MTLLSRALAAALTGFLGTLLLGPVVRAIAVRLGCVSRPVDNRWGRRVVARLGGGAIFGSFVAATLWWVPLTGSLIWLLIGASLVFMLGLVDDVRRMTPYAKLVVQLLIGCVVVIGGIRVNLHTWTWLSIPLSVLWFVFIINAFNLLDNMDGLAAGLGAIAAGFCAFHAALAQQWPVASLAMILCANCVAFLYFNFPPAKMFMGDSGSHFIGLSLAGLSLMGSWRHSSQLLSVLAFPILLLAVPIFDTCFVMIQRLANRQHPFIGGTDHVSHRLAILGLSTRQTVVVLYGVSVFLGMLSVFSTSLTPLPTVLIGLCVMAALGLIGRYLAQVNVYRGAPPAQLGVSHDPAPPETLIETMLLHKRRLVEILVDFCLVSSVYVFAHLLRFEGVLSQDLEELIVKSLPIILVIKLSCFTGYGLYRGVWRYVGVPDLVAIFKAVSLGSVLSAFVLLYLWRFEGYSRALFIIDWMLCLIAVGGARVVERLLDEWIRGLAAEGAPIVIVGAGHTGARVLYSIRSEPHGARRTVGFLDDNPKKWGDRIYGLPVLGGRERLPELLDLYQIREVLVAITDPPGDLLHFVQDACEPRGLTWKVVTAGVTDAL